ncbi:MAG: hypothetical protein QNK37_13340 [Acidobacteriota bacterium]|nr:hypothetical protein [Acidobacteriota bacterium]
MPVFIYFLLLFGGDVNSASLRQITMEEMSTAFLISAATHGERTFLITMTTMPKSEFYLYDHKANTSWELKDSRIRSIGLYIALSARKGFALLDKFGMKVIRLDAQGRFVASERLLNYDDVPLQIKLTEVFPIAEGQGLATYRDLERDVLGLAVIHVDEKRFSTLHTLPMDERKRENQYWFPVGKQLFFLDEDTLALHEVAWDSFKETKTLHSELKLIKNPRARSNVQYESYLANVVHKTGGILWERFHYEGRRAKELRDLMILDSKGFRKLDPKVFTVAEAAGRRLIFDMDDGSFLVEDME